MCFRKAIRFSLRLRFSIAEVCSTTLSNGRKCGQQARNSGAVKETIMRKKKAIYHVEEGGSRKKHIELYIC